MSIGMLRAVDLKQMEDCIARHGLSTGTHVWTESCLLNRECMAHLLFHRCRWRCFYHHLPVEARICAY